MSESKVITKELFNVLFNKIYKMGQESGKTLRDLEIAIFETQNSPYAVFETKKDLDSFINTFEYECDRCGLMHNRLNPCCYNQEYLYWLKEEMKKVKKVVQR